jgi:leucyl-tRNA synthetase
MHKRFDHKDFEGKWQTAWTEQAIYRTSEASTKPKAFILDMFPYPSGEGLHVGHPKGYIATDIYSRFKRMTGHEVLHPMGWDAFGLPAENYALKNKVHPRAAVEKNVARFKEQLAILGFDYDWDREINTTDPEYYKWTQWIFVQLFKKGLAYESYEPINWCPGCQTGLANEDLESDGTCERCGSLVEKKPMRQWVLKIRQYADRMLEDLDALNWPEHIKESQRQWIGRSKGAEIDFELDLPGLSGNVVFASNNQGKVIRIKKLIAAAGLNINLLSPADIGITDFDVEEDGKTILENSTKKALVLSNLTSLPVLGDDTGFFIEGVEIDPVTVKRNALAGKSEKELTIEEIAALMQEYYKAIATSHGGSVPAQWRSALTFAKDGKFMSSQEAVRPVILTNELHGEPDPSLPLRGLYISTVTNKYALDGDAEEEIRELAPITEALHRLFSASLKVFTTRPDTLFGATYMVLAPEHPWVTLATDDKHDVLENKEEVKAYVIAAKQKDDIERGDNTKEKTGVELKGVLAINPASGERIPLFVADYVLGGYGTGAIMAVPAHDERDNAFAKKFGLPIKRVVEPLFIQKDGGNAFRENDPVEPRNAVCVVVKNPQNNTYLALEWKKDQMHGLVTGGIDDGEDLVEAARREVTEETGYKNLKVVRDQDFSIHCKFWHRVKEVNRHARFTYVFFELENDEREIVSESEQALHESQWISETELDTFFTVFEAEFAVTLLKNPQYIHTGNGLLANSGEFDGIHSEEAKIAITQKVGGRMTNTYRLRDWVFSRQRYWGEPIPIIHCEKCGVVAVPEDQLPVTLPEVEHYEPTGTGESPLANITDWVNTTCPTCGGAGRRETNTMPQWAGSSWYYLRYMDPKNKSELVSKDREQYWAPVDLYVGGAEHATRHLIYARFWHKFLYDIGVVSTLEPFSKLHSVGLLLAEDGRKMSKRWGNVINPDDIVDMVGADTLRVYEMFMGPFESTIAWSQNGLVGARRFLERVNGLSGHIIDIEPKETLSLLHKTIKKVGSDITEFKFNTAVSAMMIFVNQAEKGGLSKTNYELFLRLLAPFAPHLTEELWHEAGHTDSIHKADFPAFDAELAKDDTVTIGVQINGKVRGTITVAPDATEAEVLAATETDEGLSGRIVGKEMKKVIYVPGRILNLIVSE